MGRRPADAGRPLALPRGVTVRVFRTEQRIQVAFSFRGVQCRELLPPQSITQTAVNLAGGLRAEIQRKIADGVFTYSDYFPDSAQAAQFTAYGHRLLLGKLLEKQLEVYERQVKNGTLSPSTLVGYRKAIKGEKMQFWAEVALQNATPSKLRDWIGSIGTTAKAARNLLTLCARAGVRYRNPYQVRHTYASTLLTNGENPWYVAQQLGHVDVEMVFRIYGKFIPQDYQRSKAATLRAVVAAD